MASQKAEKPVCTQPAAQPVKKELPKEPAPKPSPVDTGHKLPVPASKPAPKKTEQKPRETMKKASLGSKPAGK